MAYLIEGKALFLHVPKTAGKAVLAALGDRLDVRAIDAPGCHVGHASKHELDDDRFANYGRFSFCFLREPVEWYSSLWRFAENPDSLLFDIDTGLSHPFDAILPFVRRGRTIENFVSEIIYRRGGFLSWLYKRYTAYCDYIGRADHVAENLRTALRLAGIETGPIEVPRVNVSTPRDQSISKALANQIRAVEWQAVELYNKGGKVCDTT